MSVDHGFRINGQPATADDVVAVGHRMDAEDGGYPQPPQPQMVHYLMAGLDLPFAYKVLCALSHPTEPARFYVLVQREGNDPYVVYRMDPRDRSCHGGSYCSTLARAYTVLGERLGLMAAAAQECGE